MIPLRRTRRGALVAALVLAALALPASAHGTDASAADVARLAAAAREGDGAALRELRSVTSVDGVPFAAGDLLDGPPGTVDRRLETLAHSGTAHVADAVAARELAAAIVAGMGSGAVADDGGGRSILDRIGGFIADVLGPLGSPGAGWGWVVLLLLAAVAGYVLYRGLAGRTARRVHAGRAEPPGSRHAVESASRLEEDAAAAATAGRFAEAVRLRFRAGLRRLDERDLLPFDPAMTRTQLARRLPGPAFTRVAQPFDEIVYGGREASAGDASDAEQGWADVLTEARR